MFEIDDGSSKGKRRARGRARGSTLPFVAVQHAGKTLFINKTTAVWLLQEGERVSSDRLFCVRSTQPFEVTVLLVRCKDKTISVNVMNIAKQSGITDCALFALACVTCLALGIDPVTVVHDQQQLRAHFVSTLTLSYLVLKKRKPVARVVETCTVYCYCWMTDDGDMMVCCDKCDGWFHFKYLKILPSDSTTWFCDKCAVK